MTVKHRNAASLAFNLLIISLTSLQAAECLSIQAPANHQQLSNKVNQVKQQQSLGAKLTSSATSSSTAPAPTMTTPMASQQQEKSPTAASTKHLEPNLSDVSLDGEPRSSSFEASPNAEHTSDQENHEVPLATINNHSRNNQPQARPPQYVDVSNLVGRKLTIDPHKYQRNANGTMLGSQMGGSPSTLAAGLQAKSRSGLPECATQQVCNAIFMRMNYTQKLCECSSNYNWRCSNNLDPQDGHTIELTRKFDKRIYTQIKTCEPLREVRACKSPTDWTLLALQSERSGKAHYVVVCKCPTWAQLEGPYTHNHPPYANIPGIRVYGMLCAHQTARSSAQTYSAFNPTMNILPEFPWPELSGLNATNLLSTLDTNHN